MSERFIHSDASCVVFFLLRNKRRTTIELSWERVRSRHIEFDAETTIISDGSRLVMSAEKHAIMAGVTFVFHDTSSESYWCCVVVMLMTRTHGSAYSISFFPAVMGKELEWKIQLHIQSIFIYYFYSFQYNWVIHSQFLYIAFSSMSLTA